MEKKINIKAKKEIVLIFLSVFFISLVYALPPIPPLPDHFIGNVTIDGQNAVVGIQISIYVDSVLESVYNVTEAGEYDLYVATGESSDSIEFKILDEIAGTSITPTRQGGKTIFMDLSVIITPPSPPSSSGSSGGGGGGGGSSGSSGGGGGFISPPTTETSGSGSSSGEEVVQEESQEIEEQGAIRSGITGAAIGFLGSGKGIIVITVLVILGAGVVLIKFKPRKWTKNH